MLGLNVIALSTMLRVHLVPTRHAPTYKAKQGVVYVVVTAKKKQIHVISGATYSKPVRQCLNLNMDSVLLNTGRDKYLRYKAVCSLCLV
jgi:hypothetical protein